MYDVLLKGSQKERGTVKGKEWELKPFCRIEWTLYTTQAV